MTQVQQATEATPLLLGHGNKSSTNDSVTTASTPTTNTTDSTGVATANQSSSNGVAVEGKKRRILRRSRITNTGGGDNNHNESNRSNNNNNNNNNNLMMDTSNGSRDSTTSSIHSQFSKFNQSFRDVSTRVIQYVAHHTGSIGMLGSMAIAINSLTGPAMLNLPATFVRSGIIPTTTTVIFVCVVSSRCSLHMANTISKVPNNIDFQKEVEYSDVFQHFLGPRWYMMTQFIFLCCITCLNISSIVDTSQVVDVFIGNWFPGGTVGLQLFSNTSKRGDQSEYVESTFWDVVQLVRWDRSECTTDEVDEGICLPFAGCDGIVLTLGTFTTTLVFLPLALLDLKENAWWQVAGLLILIIVSLQFVVQFVMTGLQPSNLTWWGDDWNDLLGVIIFNFALVIAIPAWLYEREPHVDVPTVINYSSFIVVILYMVIGILGAMAIPHVADNMLESMMSGAFGTMLSLGASLFAFAIVGLGIPLFSVLTRLNLTGSGLCSLRTGNMLAVYGPFAAAWLLYDGQAITKLLSWGGIIFTSLVAFILPLILSIYVVRTTDTVGSISVYGSWYKEKRAHLNSLYVLITMACLSIFVAILGNLVDFDGTPDNPN